MASSSFRDRTEKVWTDDFMMNMKYIPPASVSNGLMITLTMLKADYLDKKLHKEKHNGNMGTNKRISG